MEWTGEDASARGVRQRGFELAVDGRRVPGLLWTPDPGSDDRGGRADGDTPLPPVGGTGGGPLPLVAIGHGGSNDKRQPAVVSMARRLVRHRRFAAVAIDGPVHGDRRADRGVDPRLTVAEFGQRWAAEGEAMTDAMVADWRAVVDAVQGLADVGRGRLGYWGLSMGTILGLPLVAAEPRVEVAVLGLMGVIGPTGARIAADAARVRCPVLFLVQWHDELFPRAAALELFDALGSDDKRLHAHPGAHGDVPAEELDASEAFLGARLTGPAREPARPAAAVDHVPS